MQANFRINVMMLLCEITSSPPSYELQIIYYFLPKTCKRDKMALSLRTMTYKA